MEAEKGMEVDGMEDVNMADFLVEEIWQTLNYDMPAHDDATLGLADTSDQRLPSDPTQPWDLHQRMTPTGYEATPDAFLEAPASSLNNDHQGFPLGTCDSDRGGYPSGVAIPNESPPYTASPLNLCHGLPYIQAPIIQGGARDIRVNRPPIPAARSTGLLPSGSTHYVQESQYTSPLPTGAISSVAPPQRQQQRLWAYAFDVLPSSLRK
ncbi:hypothetical protein PFICI_07300 [Pestalotiopsis fici W106-1]|uniref:Uncharacterized protein n=1 Tax=Pestalotiopsis fici (strain W106-1 / CGMCC3.15140) TaxID=1229662 RepID=W3X858_PESFW|nr:uncharacterized protein PFICI_07300 [Pestalotiopsis fici W106-1]ETS82298.1 hypothetical protein PFICI_07300 [Pestalotiopsis fici W106-1]